MSQLRVVPVALQMYSAVLHNPPHNCLSWRSEALPCYWWIS